MYRHSCHRQPKLRIEREDRMCSYGENLRYGIRRSADAVSASASSAAESAKIFMRNFPTLSTAVRSLTENVEVGTQQQMIDQGQWATALQSSDVFTLTRKPATPLDRSKPVTPAILYEAMSPEQRRKVFFEFVDFYIPLAMLQPDEKETSTTEERALLLGDEGIEKYERALLGILGMDILEGEPDADARTLATQSLQQHYLTGHLPGTISRGLDLDYTDALARNSLKGQEPFATLPQALFEKLPPSAFRGALRLGVVGSPELRILQENLTSNEHDFAVLTSETARKLDELGGITRDRLRMEAKGVADIWRDLGGFEKIALIALGAMALRTKAGQAIGMIFGGMYFFNRFVLKDKNPLKSWSQNAQRNLINPIKGLLSPVLGPYKAELEDPSGRAEIVSKFLNSFDRKNMQEQALGLSIMLDLPLDVLARNFKPTGPGTFRLNLGSDGTIDDAIKTMDPAMRKAFNTFFDSATNRDMATEAMAYTFYRMAAADPFYAADAARVERVLYRLPAGSLQLPFRANTSIAPGGASHARLPHAESELLPANGEIPNAHTPVRNASLEGDHVSDAELKEAGQTYVRLVELGHGMAVGDTQTLRSFIVGTFDLPEYAWPAEDEGGVPPSIPDDRGGLPIHPPVDLGGIPPDGPPDDVGGVPPAGPPDDAGGAPPAGPPDDDGGIPGEVPGEVGGVPEVVPGGAGGVPDAAPGAGGERPVVPPEPAGVPPVHPDGDEAPPGVPGA